MPARLHGLSPLWSSARFYAWRCREAGNDLNVSCMRMQARHDVGSSVDVGGVSVGWVVCKLLQSGALVCGCGQRLCGLAWKKVGQRQEKSRVGRRETGSRDSGTLFFKVCAGDWWVVRAVECGWRETNKQAAAAEQC